VQLKPELRAERFIVKVDILESWTILEGVWTILEELLHSWSERILEEYGQP